MVTFLRWHGATLAEAADAAQEAMIKAYERWSTVGETVDRPDAWVRTVATREFIRRRTRSREEPSDDPLVEVHTSLLRDGAAAGEDPAAEDLERRDQQLQVLHLLQLLPARQRQVMAWTYDYYTPTEIAARLSITAEAARSNLRLARRALADLIDPELYGNEDRGPGKDQP